MEHAPPWLLNSLVYLAAAVLSVPLARALGLGSIIGYLIAGIAIGPWGSALVGDPQDVLHFAEFGVVLMLFLVGLELEPKRLWQMRAPIFGWGSAQVLACAVGLMALALAFGVRWEIALVGALGLALSSTAIALQVMAERNLMRTSSGQGAFSVLLFQDVAAIPILALVPLLGVEMLSQAGVQAGVQAGAQEAAQVGATSAWLGVGKVLGVVALIVVGGRLAVRPALRFIARSRTPEIFTAASLLLVLAISLLMLSVGMSMALGAFLAGVLLSESEYRHQLEADIEPFKGLLLGLFFIAVGMSIDFGVLARAPLQLLGVLAGFLLVKLIVIYLLAAAMRMPYRDRPMFTLLLAQGGEFAFVVFQAAAGARVFDTEIASLLIGAVALSMLLTPLALVAVDRFLMPRYARAGKHDEKEIDEPQDAPVIVAGFGRYGQIVGRLLMANGIGTTVLDHDAERIASARRFGYRVFYGDATRLDLLRMAGAAEARVIVVAIDDAGSINTLVDLARAQFPQARLVVRVRDLTHAFDMLDRGIEDFERELLGSSLESARRVLDALGHDAREAQRIVQRFREHNQSLMLETHRVRHDSRQLIATTNRARADLERQMAEERREAALVRRHIDAVADSMRLPPQA